MVSKRMGGKKQTHTLWPKTLRKPGNNIKQYHVEEWKLWKLGNLAHPYFLTNKSMGSLFRMLLLAVVRTRCVRSSRKDKNFLMFANCAGMLQTKTVRPFLMEKKIFPNINVHDLITHSRIIFGSHNAFTFKQLLLLSNTKLMWTLVRTGTEPICI